MTNLLIGAGLLLFLLAVIPPALTRRIPLLSFLRYVWGDVRPRPAWHGWRELWADEVGAVAVSYFIRGGPVLILGSATPPTAIQASQVYVQKAQISFADSDTQALFTHNWGLDVSAVSYFDPEVLGIVAMGPAQPAQTYLPAFTFDFSNTNVVKINKLNFLGTGGTYLFGFRKPHSLGQ